MPRWWKSLCRQTRLHNQKEPRRAWESSQRQARHCEPVHAQLDQLEPRMLFSGSTYTENNGLAVIEAENYTASVVGVNDMVNSTWTEVADTGVGGGTYIEGLPNDGDGSNTDGARLDFDVDFTNTGTYYMWVRMNGATSTDDSVHLGMDGTVLSLGGAGLTDKTGNWVWEGSVLRSGPDEVTASITSSGVHTVNLWMREDGVKVDRIILTDDANYTPSGIGPASTEVTGPSASASGAASVDEGSTYTLDFSVTGATASAWSIDWGDGSTPDGLAGTAAQTTHTYADDAASYTVTATATTGQGTLIASPVTVAVNNVAPMLSVTGNATVEVGQTYTLSLSATDPGTDTLTQWTVDWGDGSTPDVLAGGTTSTTHIFNAAGTPSIQVTATDEDGTFSATALPITVSAPANPTATTSGVGSIDEGGTYTLGLNVVDAIVTAWDIDWGDGSAVQNVGDVSSVDHVYADGSANHTVTATATTDQGNLTASPLAVTVNNVDPTLTATGAGAATVGQVYALTLGATDPGADTITGWSIDWGDGAPEAITGNPSSVGHTYTTAGTYNIVATATDEDGNTAAAAINVVASVPGAETTTTVDFEGLPVGNLTSGGSFYVDPSGYRFRDAGPLETGLAVESVYGSEYIRPQQFNRGVILDLDGETFDLASFDYRRRGGDDANMTIVGTLVGGGTVSDSLSINSSNASGIKTLNWTGLTEVHIDFGPTLHRWALFNDFVLTSSSGGGSTNTAPTDITLSNAAFAEDAATDTLVGTLAAVDADAGDTHTYSIIGGDTASFVIANGNELRTNGTFDYETQGSYSVTIRAADAANEAFDKTFALSVTDVTETVAAATISGAATIDEGGTYTLGLAVTDAIVTGWNIDWGDGSPIETVGDLASTPYDYADGGATYIITAVANTDEGLLSSNSLSVTVANVAPTLNVAGDATIEVGQTYTLTLGATDPGDDTITQWSVDWGDGSDAEVLAGTETSATHVFTVAGTPNIVAAATDEDGTYLATALPVTVQTTANANATIGGASSLDEGGSYTLSLAVTDATATGWEINWGDGTVETVGDLASTSHIYADGSSTYNITAAATTDQGVLTSNSLAVAVANIAPTLTITGDAAIEVGQTYTVALSATDPGDDTITQWSIDWGDGTAADVLAGTATSATHQFLYEGVFNVVATAIDEDGSYTSNTYAVSASYSPTAAASISGPSTVDEGGLYTLGLALTDALATSWTIDWGDGTPADNWVGYATEATHTYSDGDASHTITAIALTDQGVLQANDVSINIDDVSPTITLSGTDAAMVGEAFTLGLAAFDPGTDVRSQWQIDWGDGSGVQTVDGGAGSQDHTYTVAGSYTISVSVTDEDGTHGAETYTLSVADPVNYIEVDVSSPDIVENEEFDLMVSPVGFTVDQWFMDFGDGQPVEIFGRNRFGGFVSFDFASSYFTPGSYELLLTAVNNSGDSAAAAPIKLRVTGVDDIVRGELFTTSGIDYSVALETTDPATGESLTGWSIDWGDGNTSSPANGDTTTIHSYAAPGDYLVTGTASLSGGGQAVTTFAVIVETPIINGLVPTIDASSTSSLVIQEGDEFTLQLSNNDYPVTSWTVDWGDPTWGGTETLTWPDRLLPNSSAEMTHPYRNANNASSVFTITSTVETVEGTTETNTINVTVQDVAPVSNIRVPNKFKVGESFTLINSWYDPADQYDNRVYTIDWGDGSSDSPFGENDYATFRRHTYLTEGEYTITVTAVDESGAFTSTHEISSFRPDPVQSLDIEEIIDGAVVLTWDATDQATEYRVERRDLSSEVWQELATVTAGATTYSDSSGVTETRYVYRVTSLNNLYEAEPSGITYGKFITTTGDEDLDGLTNGYEAANGLSIYDRDSDGDQLHDGWEVTYGDLNNQFDPLVVNSPSDDFDNDGLTNAKESAASTNPNSADTDGDGVEDQAEINNGTDANDATDLGTATHLFREFAVSLENTYFPVTALENAFWPHYFNWGLGINVGQFSDLGNEFDYTSYEDVPSSIHLRQGESYGVSVDLLYANLWTQNYIPTEDDIPWDANITDDLGYGGRGLDHSFYSESIEGLLGRVDAATYAERVVDADGSNVRQGGGQVNYLSQAGRSVTLHVPQVSLRFADLELAQNQIKTLDIGQTAAIQIGLSENINFANPDVIDISFNFNPNDFDLKRQDGTLLNPSQNYAASTLGVDPGQGEVTLLLEAKAQASSGSITATASFLNKSGADPAEGLVTTSSKIRVGISADQYLDLDIDSNNNNGYGLMEGDVAEEFIEGDSNQGKWLGVNDYKYTPIALTVNEFDTTSIDIEFDFDDTKLWLWSLDDFVFDGTTPPTLTTGGSGQLLYSGQSYPMQDLGLSPGEGRLFWAQSINYADGSLPITVAINSIGDQLNAQATDTVYVRTIASDIDVDYNRDGIQDLAESGTLQQPDEVNQGGLIQLNSNDDDKDSIEDRIQLTSVNEDDLLALQVSQTANGLVGGQLVLNILQGGQSISIWDGPQKSGVPLFGGSTDIGSVSWNPTGSPSTVYVEGISESGIKGIQLELTRTTPDGIASRDLLNLTVTETNAISHRFDHFNTADSSRQVQENGQTYWGTFADPFSRGALHSVTEIAEDNSELGPGIRYNNNSLGQPEPKNLIEVQLKVPLGDLAGSVGGSYHLRRSANDIDVYFGRNDPNNLQKIDANAKFQFFGDSTLPILIPPGAESISVWVSWNNASRGTVDLSLELRQNVSNGPQINDTIRFHRAESMVVSIGGNGADPYASGGFGSGTYQVADILYERLGYDVYKYGDEDIDGGDAVNSVIYSDIVNGLVNRDIENIVLIGHSQGAGAAYELSKALSDNGFGGHVKYVAYIDGIRNDGALSESRSPLNSTYFVNLYQRDLPTRGTSIVGSNIGFDVTTKTWGANLGHTEIDNDPNVLNILVHGNDLGLAITPPSSQANDLIGVADYTAGVNFGDGIIDRVSR